MNLDLLDLPMIAAATLLLFSGMLKIADPGPIAATLESLATQVMGQPLRPRSRGLGLVSLGRLLGVAEIGVVVWIVLGRSWTAAAALTALAAGFAGAGMVGALHGDKVACACLGKRGRPLGYLHVVQFPLWLGAAWSAARAGHSNSMDDHLILLAVCATLASYLHVLRMWTTVVPLARDRRRASTPAGAAPRTGHGEDPWSQPL